jgi:uncharacterized protein YjbI with pentapeptide repeats
MANDEHVALLTRDADIWNEWREANPDIRPDLSGASIGWRKHNRANLSGANLSGAAFDGAMLIDANFSRADLSGANFLLA